MSDLVSVYMNEKRLSLSPGTIRVYWCQLKSFTRWLDKSIELATRADILSYLNFLMFEKNNAKSTVSSCYVVLNTFYVYLVDNDFIPKNPMRTIKNVRIEKRAPVYLTTVEVDQIISFISGLKKKEDDKLVFLLFYATGMRISELLSLRKNNIDFHGGTIKVFGKGSKERFVILPGEVLMMLKEYSRPLSDDGRLFRMSARTLQRKIKRICEFSGVNKNISPHKLRHTFATHLLQGGCNVVALQKLMGHNSVNTTQIYTHYNVDDLKEIYAKAHPLNNI